MRQKFSSTFTTTHFAVVVLVLEGGVLLGSFPERFPRAKRSNEDVKRNAFSPLRLNSSHDAFLRAKRRRRPPSRSKKTNKTKKKENEFFWLFQRRVVRLYVWGFPPRFCPPPLIALLCA